MKKTRSSQRLKDFDYSIPRSYFVTICTQHRLPLFGSIRENAMILNDAGRMVLQTWEQSPDHYPGIGIDTAQVMSDHFHGIVVIHPGVGAAPRGRPNPHGHPNPDPQPDDDELVDDGWAQGPAPTAALSLSDVMERFKSLTTTRYIDGVKQMGWPPFPKTLWQRNYHDRITRNTQELERIRIYIRNNPVEWKIGEHGPEQ